VELAQLRAGGELSRDGDRWVLRPDRFIPGVDSMGPVAMVKAFRELSAARRYLAAAVGSAPARLRTDDLVGPRPGVEDGLPSAGETSQTDER
jgi:hypothetical protein